MLFTATGSGPQGLSFRLTLCFSCSLFYNPDSLLAFDKDPVEPPLYTALFCLNFFLPQLSAWSLQDGHGYQ